MRRILKDSGLEEHAEAHAAVLMSLLGVQNEETKEIKFEAQKDTLLALLVALSAFRPVVIVVEDGEHVDAASLKVLDELVETKLHDCQILLLVGVRAKGLQAGSCMVDWCALCVSFSFCFS